MEQMSDFEETVVRLLEGLSTEIEQLRAELRSEMNAGFARIEATLSNQQTRLERHAGLLQSGSRWVNRMNQWSEKVDQQLAERNAKIQELEKRIERLEKNGGRPS